ncbi:hypothetical protein ACQPYK_29550 [Streptosporangium sp. CA-135522]|uniref:hypothetical protein n=1 Tax=Streptosporangium sp. CA-135522 TaxID=3240072 RepID=UPI003D9500FE
MSAKSDDAGCPRVVYIEDEARRILGIPTDAEADDLRVILPITDPYTVHHGARKMDGGPRQQPTTLHQRRPCGRPGAMPTSGYRRWMQLLSREGLSLSAYCSGCARRGWS